MSMSRSELETGRTGASEAREQVGAAVGEMKDKAQSMLEHAETLASDGLDRFEVAVRRNPLASAAIAAGVGFFLAVLARR